MTIESDPHGEESSALFAMADFTARRVLEIGSGDGRLTRLYAHRAGHVTAIEAFQPALERAIARQPADLRGRVDLRNTGFEDLAASTPSSSFDLVILSWTL